MLRFKKCCCTLWFAETSGLPCTFQTFSTTAIRTWFRLFSVCAQTRFQAPDSLVYDNFLLIRKSAGTKWWKDTDWSNNILRHWPRNTRHNVWNYIGLNYKRVYQILIRKPFGLTVANRLPLTMLTIWINKVSGKLPTYPSPNPTFCPEWEVSLNVSLGEG